MNEQFQQYLMGILEKTGEFLSTEIPEVAHQILMFNLVVAVLCVSFGVVLIGVGCYYLIKFFNIEGKSSDAEDIMLIPGHGAPIVGIFFITMYINDALKIWLAPKLYLLEYAADLVK